MAHEHIAPLDTGRFVPLLVLTHRKHYCDNYRLGRVSIVAEGIVRALPLYNDGENRHTLDSSP